MGGVFAHRRPWEPSGRLRPVLFPVLVLVDGRRAGLVHIFTPRSTTRHHRHYPASLAPSPGKHLFHGFVWLGCTTSIFHSPFCQLWGNLLGFFYAFWEEARPLCRLFQLFCRSGKMPLFHFFIFILWRTGGMTVCGGCNYFADSRPKFWASMMLLCVLFQPFIKPYWN